MTLVQLVFESALFKESEATLADIFATSRRNNKKNNITGMVLCSGNSIISVLEGECAVVRQTFERISGDQRHSVTRLVCEQSVQSRHFSKWNTGYRKAPDPGSPARSLHDAYFFDGFDLLAFRNSRSPVSEALSTFVAHA